MEFRKLGSSIMTGIMIVEIIFLADGSILLSGEHLPDETIDKSPISELAPQAVNIGSGSNVTLFRGR